MPNLNYDVTQGVTQDVTQDVTQGNLDIQIIELIAMALGVSTRTIKRHIKEMDNVCYIGRGASGHWEITDKEY